MSSKNLSLLKDFLFYELSILKEKKYEKEPCKTKVSWKFLWNSIDSKRHIVALSKVYLGEFFQIKGWLNSQKFFYFPIKRILFVGLSKKLQVNQNLAGIEEETPKRYLSILLHSALSVNQIFVSGLILTKV